MSGETKDKHTPGYWTLVGLRIIRNGTQPTGLFNVADCADPTANHIDGNIEERIANAKLIAASPDLLAALVLCVEDYERGMIETDAWQMLHIGKVERPPTPYHIMAARAAIAKAREG